MGEIKENFFENNALFKFETYSCNMVTDIIHNNTNGEPSYIYKLIADQDKPITLAYAAKKGLVRIASNGSIEEENILGTFMSLCDKPEKDLIKFINENGFIFPIESDTFEEIKKEEMINIITRLKLTVELMSFISSTRKDYYKIISNIMILLLFQPIEIKTEQMKNSYKSYQYKYIDLLQSFSGTLSYKREQQKFDSDVFTIEEDTIFPNYVVNIADYNDCVSDTTNTDVFKNILQMYVNMSSSDVERKITDVLFHSLEKCKSLTVFLNNKDNALIDLNSLDDKFKAEVIEVANYIIGEEINSNLGRIHPVYNAEKRSPS